MGMERTNKQDESTEPLSGHLSFFFLVRALNCAHVLLIMFAHLVKRVHEIRSNFDKTAFLDIYLLFFLVIMDRDSIIPFYFSLGMHYGDILSTLASHCIVFSESRIQVFYVHDLLVSFPCFEYVVRRISCPRFVSTFNKLCTRFGKTSA